MSDKESSQRTRRKSHTSAVKEVADLPLAARLHAGLAQVIAEGREDEAADASDRLIDYILKFTHQALHPAIG